MLASFAQPDLEPRLVRKRLHPPYARRHHDGVVETEAAPQPPEFATARRAVHLHVVHALDLPCGMHQALGQGAIAGEKEQPGTLEVEAADRVDPLAELRYERADRRPPFGVRERADDPPRLVQHDRARSPAAADALAVDGDLVARGVGARPQLLHDRPVDADAAGPNQLFRPAP
jgi:hypothetical protein